MLYMNGRKYEGEWVNDKREGRGFEKYSNGNYYLQSYGVFWSPHTFDGIFSNKTA